MGTEKLIIAGREMRPGTKTEGVLTVPRCFADGQDMEIPFMVVRGVEPGKTLYAQVAQHGCEIMGLDALRRLIAELDPTRMRGTFIYCLPNPLAFREKVRESTFDPIPSGMNRVWPGNPDGGVTERAAHKVWNELILRSDEVIDLHTATRRCPVWVFYEAEGVSDETPSETARRSERMARHFAAPIVYVETEPLGERRTLRARCVDQGIPAIVPELGGAGYFDEEVVTIAQRGIKNIMKDLGIIEGELERPETQVKLIWRLDEKPFTARAGVGGVFVPQVTLGDIVKKGDPVGFVYSPRNFETLETLHAPSDGYVFRISENPVCHPGDYLISIPEIEGKCVSV